MLLGTAPKLYHHSNLQLSINEEIIGNVDSHKLQGVHFDKKLTWNTHVDYICKLAASRLTLMQTLQIYLPLHARKLFYCSYISPLLDCCCTIWGSCSRNNIETLVKLQKRAAQQCLF